MDRSGVLDVKQIEKRVQNFAASHLMRDRTPLYSGTQFATRKMRTGVLFGYLLCLLECMNAPLRGLNCLSLALLFRCSFLIISLETSRQPSRPRRGSPFLSCTACVWCLDGR